MNDDSSRSSLQTASPSNPSCEAPFDSSKPPHSDHLIDILVREPRWKTDFSVNYHVLIQEALCAVLCAVFKNTDKTDPFFELSVLLTDDSEIRSLNKEYRQKDTPTNILSFESGYILEGGKNKQVPEIIPLGDLVLSYETLKKEADSQQKTFQDHMTHLLIHGLLHLFGFDHENDKEAEEMEALEITLLKKFFHIKNPYIEKG